MAKEKIVVYSSEKDKYHTTGAAIECATQAMADHLIKNGMATKGTPKEKSK